MIEIDLEAPTEETEELIACVEEFAAREGLSFSRTTLKSHPGSVHWHLKRSKHPGTLETTWDPDKKRFWLKVQPLRSAAWIDLATAAFKETFGETLSR